MCALVFACVRVCVCVCVCVNVVCVCVCARTHAPDREESKVVASIVLVAV